MSNLGELYGDDDMDEAAYNSDFATQTILFSLLFY